MLSPDMSTVFPPQLDVVLWWRIWLTMLTNRSYCRPRKVLGSLRGHQRRELPEVCHQGPQTGQEEED